MAEFKDKRGWEWTVEERRVRQLPLRRARNLLSQIREQAFRTGLHMPQFKTQADDALQHLKDGLAKLARMDLSSRGRKYDPLSPEEFDRIITTIPALMQPWKRLATSPAYAAAVCQVNRDIRARNTIVAAQEAAMFRDVDAITRLADSGDLPGALRYAADKGLL